MKNYLSPTSVEIALQIKENLMLAVSDTEVDTGGSDFEHRSKQKGSWDEEKFWDEEKE